MPSVDALSTTMIRSGRWVWDSDGRQAVNEHRSTVVRHHPAATAWGPPVNTTRSLLQIGVQLHGRGTAPLFGVPRKQATRPQGHDLRQSADVAGQHRTSGCQSLKGDGGVALGMDTGHGHGVTGVDVGQTSGTSPTACTRSPTRTRPRRLISTVRPDGGGPPGGGDGRGWRASPREFSEPCPASSDPRRARRGTSGAWPGSWACGSISAAVTVAASDHHSTPPVFRESVAGRPHPRSQRCRRGCTSV